MSSSGEVTKWIQEMQAGDRRAVQKLWEAYFRRLVGFARKKLGELPRRAADEEDVALSAFDSFIRGAEQGRFPRLEDRDDLWQLLLVIAGRKVIDLATYEGRDKRDWHRLSTESGSGSSLHNLIGREPDPAFAVELAETCRCLLERLPDDQLRQIALLQMEGCTNQEIGVRLDVSLATVERRLGLIRKTWDRGR